MRSWQVHFSFPTQSTSGLSVFMSISHDCHMMYDVTVQSFTVVFSGNHFMKDSVNSGHYSLQLVALLLTPPSVVG